MHCCSSVIVTKEEGLWSLRRDSAVLHKRGTQADHRENWTSSVFPYTAKT